MINTCRHQATLNSGARFIHAALPELFHAAEAVFGKNTTSFFTGWGAQECLTVLAAHRKALSEMDSLLRDSPSAREISRGSSAILRRTSHFRILAPFMEAWGMAQLRREYSRENRISLYISDFEFHRCNDWRGPDGLVVSPGRDCLKIKAILEAKSGSTFLIQNQLAGWINKWERSGLSIGSHCYRELYFETQGGLVPLNQANILKVLPEVTLVVTDHCRPALDAKFNRVRRVESDLMYETAKLFFQRVLVSGESSRWLRIIEQHKAAVPLNQDHAIRAALRESEKAVP